MIQFIVHDEEDSVGVVVVEGCQSGAGIDRLSNGAGQDHKDESS